MKKIEKAMIVGLIFSILVGSYTAFAQKCGQIRESVLRLHMLANSDREEDQALPGPPPSVYLPYRAAFSSSRAGSATR